MEGYRDGTSPSAGSASAYERTWVPRTDTTDLHPLWGGHPSRLVRDRAWRKDIPMASDGLCGVDWTEPTHAEGLGVLS